MGKGVCFECINDFYLKKTIKDEGKPRECSICGGKNNNAFTVEQLAEVVGAVMGQHFIRGLPIQEIGEGEERWGHEGDQMSSFVQNVLNQYLDFADEIVDAIIESQYDWLPEGAQPLWDKTSKYVERRSGPWPYFDEWQSTLDELKHSRRFFSPAAQTLFGKLFEGVEDLRGWNGKKFQPVVRGLPTGTKLFRARICKSQSMLRDIISSPFKHVGPPPKEYARAGRMNPEGVTVFYGSRELDTCFAEMRPALGNDVAIITLRTTKPLRVLDFSRLEQTRGGGALSYFQPDFTEQVNKQEFLHHIHRLISQHVIPGRESDYLITQTMSEYLAHVHHKPFDGILFDSTQRENGTNVVLFPQANWFTSSLEEIFRVAYVPRSIKLLTTTSIKYEHQESEVESRITENDTFEMFDDEIPF